MRVGIQLVESELLHRNRDAPQLDVRSVARLPPRSLSRRGPVRLHVIDAKVRRLLCRIAHEVRIARRGFQPFQLHHERRHEPLARGVRYQV